MSDLDDIATFLSAVEGIAAAVSELSPEMRGKALRLSLELFEPSARQLANGGGQPVTAADPRFVEAARRLSVVVPASALLSEGAQHAADFVRKTKKATRAAYAKAAGVSTATATKRLGDAERAGAIRSEGVSRSKVWLLPAREAA